MHSFKKHCLHLIIIFLVGASALIAQERSSKENTKNEKSLANSNDSSHVEYVYQCQVHPQIISNFEGRCPRCDLELKRFTLEQAFANLNEKGVKKPELSLNYITKKVEEDTTNSTDTTAVKDSASVVHIDLSVYDWEAIDHDGDGNVWQCPNHPEEVEDEEGNCYQCGTAYVWRTVKDAKRKLMDLVPKEESGSEKSKVSTTGQKP
jgi:hypothetical protein